MWFRNIDPIVKKNGSNLFVLEALWWILVNVNSFLVEVKSYKISPPLLRVMSLKMTTRKLVLSHYRRVEGFPLFVPRAKWRNKCLPREKIPST